jgi:sRNA-binding protein
MAEKPPLDYPAATAMLAQFGTRWPAVFTGSRPLAYGIHKAIAGVAPELDITIVGQALALYPGRKKYLKACTTGAPRIGLDGEAMGEVTKREAANAVVRVKGKQPPVAKPKVKEEAITTSPAVVTKVKEGTITTSSVGDGLAALRAAAQARRKGAA